MDKHKGNPRGRSKSADQIILQPWWDSLKAKVHPARPVTDESRALEEATR